MDPEQTAPRGAVWSGHTVCKNDFQNHKQTTKQMTIVVIGSLRVKISASTIYNLLMCLRTTECVANSVDPGQMPCSATSDLGVQWLLRPVHSILKINMVIIANLPRKWSLTITGNVMDEHILTGQNTQKNQNTVNALKFLTPKWPIKWHMQTVQTQIRLLLKGAVWSGSAPLPFHQVF